MKYISIFILYLIYFLFISLQNVFNLYNESKLCMCLSKKQSN